MTPFIHNDRTAVDQSSTSSFRSALLKRDIMITSILVLIFMSILYFKGLSDIYMICLAAGFVISCIGVEKLFLKRLTQKPLEMNFFISSISLLTFLGIAFFIPSVKVEGLILLPMGITLLIYYRELKSSKLYILAILMVGMIFQLYEFSNLNIENLTPQLLSLNLIIISFICALSISKVYLLFNWGNYYVEELQNRDLKYQNLEAQFENFMREIPIGYCIFNEDGTKLYSSNKSQEIFGYDDKSEFLNASFDKICHPEHISIFEGHFKNLAEDNYGSYPVQFTGITKDGSERIIEGRVSLNNTKGQKSASCVFTDSTEVIEQREALAQREMIYNSIIKSSQDGIFAVDSQFNLIAINPVVQKSIFELTGHKLKEGDNFAKYMPNSFIERYSKQIEKSIAGEIIHFQDRSQINNKKNLDFMFMPMLGENDKVLGVLVVYRDITQLKIKEAELIRKELRSRTIIDAIPGGIATINLDSKLEYVSLLTAQTFGYSEDQLLGTSILDYFDQESQVNLLSYVSDLLAGLTPAIITLKGLNAQGGHFYIEGKGRIIVDEETNLKKVFGIFIDATDKIRAEKQLQEREATLNAIFNSTSESILAYDENYNIIAFNQNWEKDILQFVNIKPTVGDNLQRILPDGAWNFLIKNSEEALKNGSLTLQKKHSLISDLYINLEITKLQDQNGEVIGWLEVIRDVTELKDKENELINSKKTFQNIFEKSPIGILTTEGETITSVNPFICSLTGFQQSELIGQQLSMFISPEDIELFNEVITHTDKSIKKNIDIILRVINKEKATKYVLIKIYQETTQVGMDSRRMITMTDITDLKNSEKLLQASKEKYKDLFTKTLTGMYISKNGKMEDLNPVLTNTLGYDYAEMVGRNITDFLETSEAIRITKLIDMDIALQKGSSDIITLAIHKTGRNIEIFLRVVYEYDDAGRCISDFGSINDLSDLTYAERALDESENQNKNIIETLPGGIIECDFDGTITFASQNAYEILQYKEKSLTGENALDFIHEESLTTFLESFGSLLQGSATIASNTIKLNINNREIYVEAQSRMLKNSHDKKSSRVLTIFLDISERIKMQNDLANQKAIVDSTIENSPDMIIALDNSNRITGFNQKAKDRLYDISKIELCHNESLVTLTKEANEQTFSREWNKRLKIISQGNHSNFTIKLQSSSEEPSKYFEHRLSPILDKDSKVIGKVIFIRDITSDKEYQLTIENQVKEMEKYIESNLQLENFAYIASHDLKAPLRTVSSFAFLLKNSSYDKLDERGQEFLNIIVDSSRKMQILIDDLLTFSRTNTQKTHIQQISTKKILQDVLRQLSVDIDLAKTNIIIEHENIQDIVMADPVKMSQLLLNLVSNAVKFSSKADHPTVVISGSYSDKYWYFSVKDNGVGIKEENQKAIFEMFKKLHSNDVFEGTGLGLTICSKIVEQHGGEIWVESVFEQGAKFIFTIDKKIGQVNQLKLSVDDLSLLN